MVIDRNSRHASPPSGPVALFIDWDNFAIGLRQEMPERPPDLGPILRWARRSGVLIVCRAYGEWRDATERLAIYNAGVEAVYAPVLPLGGSLAARSGAGGAKSLADTAMAVDVAEFLALMPSIATLILATSDKDLIPVVRFAQKRGVYASVVGSDRTASALRDLADEYVSYRQLLDDEAPQPIATSRPVTVPPIRTPRPLRRFGDPIESSLGRETRPVIAQPFIRRDPAVAITPVGPETETPEPDDDANSAARRRRRGGRRRRGAETLDLALPTTNPTLEPAEERPTPPAEQIVPATPLTSVPNRGSRPLPEAGARQPFERVTRPRIVPPLIVAPDPQAVPIAADLLPSEVSSANISASDDLREVPVATRFDIAPPPSEAFTRPARVQLPGERLRKLAVSPVTLDAPSLNQDQGEIGVEAVAPVSEPLVDGEALRGLGTTATDDGGVQNHIAPSPVGSVTAETSELMRVNDAIEPADAELPPEPAEATDGPASRPRRRRGGRGGRTGDPSEAGQTTETDSSTISAVLPDGPLASPLDPDSAEAPNNELEGTRPRRRGGRARTP